MVLRTTFGEEISSTLFAFDKGTDMLLLKEVGSHNGVANLRFLKASFVDKVISVEKPTEPVDPKLPYVSARPAKRPQGLWHRSCAARRGGGRRSCAHGGGARGVGSAQRTCMHAFCALACVLQLLLRWHGVQTCAAESKSTGPFGVMICRWTWTSAGPGRRRRSKQRSGTQPLWAWASPARRRSGRQQALDCWLLLAGAVCVLKGRSGKEAVEAHGLELHGWGRPALSLCVLVSSLGDARARTAVSGVTGPEGLLGPGWGVKQTAVVMVLLDGECMHCCPRFTHHPWPRHPAVHF